MTNPLRRSSPAPARPRTRGAGPRGPIFAVESWTQHWRRIGDRWYRDAVVILPDGSRHLYALPMPEETAA